MAQNNKNCEKFHEIFFQRNLTYSRVPNKRTGRLLENEKKSCLYALIRDHSFINFQQKVPPIRLFPLTFLLIVVLSMAHFDLRRPQGHFEATIKNFILEYQAASSIPNCMLPKIPPMRLLIFSKKSHVLLIFKEISHLYFYSEPSSIRNSRVVIYFT